jgi:hypothetical protein
MKLFHQRKAAVIIACTFLVSLVSASAQQPTYPDKIRGYKLSRANVEPRKPNQKKTKTANDDESSLDLDAQALIRFGPPQLARVTPLGVSFEISIVVNPVRQKGQVDFLVFEEMLVNGTSVEIDEYHHSFDLPNKTPLTLKEPLKFYVYLPNALLAAVDEWSNSKKTWLVEGRLYVFGRYKKMFFTFKRYVPIELKIAIDNPLD